MIRRLLRTPEKRDLDFEDIWKRGLDATTNRTTAGELVGYDEALTLSAVYAGIRIISDTISTLNFDVYYRQNGTERAFRPLPLWVQDMSPYLRNHEVLGQVLTSLLLDGNAFLATLRDTTGAVIEVTPLDLTSITVNLDQNERGRQQLTFTSSQAPAETFTQNDITHIRGMMKAGSVRGLSPIASAREFLGLGIAVQKYGAAFFGNGALPGAVVEVPNSLSPEGADALKGAWNDIHRGAANGSRLAVLTEGAKFSKISLSPEDSQFLQSRSMTVNDVGRLFGLPNWLLNDASGSTSWGSGLAEQSRAFIMYSLRPYITRLEAGLTSILRSQGISVAYLKFDTATMNRGTPETLDKFTKGLQAGVYNIDEVRAAEGLPPLPNGDGQTHYVPMNLAPVDGPLEQGG